MRTESTPVTGFHAATPRLARMVLGTRARRWLTLLLGAAAALLAGSARAEAEAASPASGPSGGQRPEAWVIGSSSVHQALGRIIASELRRQGYHARLRAFSSAGLARPDYRDMQRAVEALPIGKKTAAVFVYLGTNDAQALWLRPTERTRADRKFLPWRNARWSSLYRERARQLLERICQRGAGRALMVLPVDVGRPRLQHRLQRIRALQAQAAEQTSCGVALATAGDEARLAAARSRIRHADGFHMTPQGAKLVWERIRGAAWQAMQQPRGSPNRAQRRAGRRAELDALVNRMLSGHALQ